MLGKYTIFFLFYLLLSMALQFLVKLGYYSLILRQISATPLNHKLKIVSYFIKFLSQLFVTPKLNCIIIIIIMKWLLLITFKIANLCNRQSTVPKNDDCDWYRTTNIQRLCKF